VDILGMLKYVAIDIAHTCDWCHVIVQYGIAKHTFIFYWLEPISPQTHIVHVLLVLCCCRVARCGLCGCLSISLWVYMQTCTVCGWHYILW